MGKAISLDFAGDISSVNEKDAAWGGRSWISLFADEAAGWLARALRLFSLGLWESPLGLERAHALSKAKQDKKTSGQAKSGETSVAGKGDGQDQDYDDYDDDNGDGDDDDDYDDDDDDEDDDDDDDPIEEEEDEGARGSGAEDLSNIEQFLSGDEQAFVRLVTKYQHKVYNLCFRVLGDRDEAMDMAQEVFITTHRSLGNFRGDSLFSTWIFRVTVNHCKNRIKYLGRRKYYQSVSIDQPQEHLEGEVFYEPEDESPDPEQNLASDEVQEIIQDAINSLDGDHAIVISLRDIQDMSYEEIAEILDIKVGTVKSRIHRARNELKKKLEGKLPALQ